MSNDDYLTSVRTRLRVMYPPARLVLTILSIVWAVALTVIYISNHGSPEWAGSISVIPLLACLAWACAIDTKCRRAAKNAAGTPRQESA